MKIIKLDSTSSTNTFLKDLHQTIEQDDFTVITTQKQNDGRGQMNSKWISEDFKNLTFSVLCKFNYLDIKNKRYLNFAVSLAIFHFLKDLNVPKLAIKWPNDILSDRKKICGILIENSLSRNDIKSSIIGIGLNVNQKNFPKHIKATSVSNKLNREFDLDKLLTKLLKKLSEYINLIHNQKHKKLEEEYLNALYLKNIPSMFTANDTLFIGKILGVNEDGKLLMELDDESIKSFGVKEISFIK